MNEEYKVHRSIILPTALRLLADGEVIWCDSQQCYIWIEDGILRNDSKHVIIIEKLRELYSTVKVQWYDSIPKDGIFCKVWDLDIDNAAYTKVIEYFGDKNTFYKFKTRNNANSTNTENTMSENTHKFDRYNQGFGCFGPLEQCKDGKLMFVEDHQKIMSSMISLELHNEIVSDMESRYSDYVGELSRISNGWEDCSKDWKKLAQSSLSTNKMVESVLLISLLINGILVGLLIT